MQVQHNHCARGVTSERKHKFLSELTSGVYQYRVHFLLEGQEAAPGDVLEFILFKIDV